MNNHAYYAFPNDIAIAFIESKSKAMIQTSTMKWLRHIRLLPMVVVLNVQSSLVFGLFLCVFVWKTTKTLAMNGRTMFQTS